MKIAKKLRAWFQRDQRDLPWRHTRDPYAIWLSEIMLQQTRVAAVIPYYRRFLAKFPDYHTLAAAPEAELLAAWAGLGYYSRARNLQKSAQMMVASGGFPSTHEGILALAGVGVYTAGAVASIAFGLPEVGIDGNVIRVLSRVTGGMADLRAAAVREMDRTDPGSYQQALMELGATICLPRNPKCLLCPVSLDCKAHALGIEETLPVKAAKPAKIDEDKVIFWIVRDGSLLLWQRPAASRRLAGFWELPESGTIVGVKAGQEIASFKHSIVNHRYTFTLRFGSLSGKITGDFVWVPLEKLPTMPASTVLRKSLALTSRI